ncbi:MAG: hypothetical protein U9M95_00115 [Candidatus Altiarchaeota archaeon]|nr:hypothetical protein [Candidatus Altiarchaeota archaeon]
MEEKMKKSVLVLLIASIVLVGFGESAGAVGITKINQSSISHGDSITISGSGFGVKSPAAPIVWDACDDSSPVDVDTIWNGQNYPLVAGDEDNLPDYRTSYPTGNPMSMPNAHVTKYLCGAMTTVSGSWENSNSAVCFTHFPSGGWPTRKLFAMYYYRIASTFSIDDGTMGGHNMKEFACNLNGNYLDPPQNYLDHCNGATPVVTNPNDAQMKCQPSGYGSSCGGGQFYYNNPMLRWQHMELQWDSSGYLWHFSDGVDCDDHLWCTEKVLRTDFYSMTVGGFSRWPLTNDTGNYRYWAAVYLDDTYARVMLGNNPSWDSCTIREPQIPSAWSDDSIKCNINLGALPDNGTAYLFVFDENNTHNEVGYPITSIIEGHKADLNDDGVIGMPELMIFIGRWKAGDGVTKAEVEDARGLWLGGGVY